MRHRLPYTTTLVRECAGPQGAGCGAELAFSVAYAIDPGEPMTRDFPGYEASIDGIEVTAERASCAVCGTATEAAVGALEEELDHHPERAWYELRADLQHDDGRW